MGAEEPTPSLGKYITTATEVIKITVPPAVLFLLLLADTYSTIIGLEMGFVEVNHRYQHFNTVGVTEQDIYNRLHLATTTAVLLFLAEIGARIDRKHREILHFTTMILWLLILMEAFVVYNNLLQVATAINTTAP